MTTPQQIPTTDEEYVVWANRVIGVDFNDRSIELSYEQNASFAQGTAQDHDFFKGLDDFLRQSLEQYRTEHHADLFMSGVPSVLLKLKSFTSAVNKSFRHNIVLNDNFGNPPEGGWVTPDNWFTTFDDVVRTTIVCKFIDGPKFLAERLEGYATALGLESHYSSHQKDRGYYAYHFYLKLPVRLLISGIAKDVVIEIEIQLATQLQEILYEITHRYYEALRNLRVVERGDWKWEFGTNRFRAGYLSHTLHLLEAIILELRDSEEGRAGGEPPERKMTALVSDSSGVAESSQPVHLGESNNRPEQEVSSSEYGQTKVVTATSPAEENEPAGPTTEGNNG